MSQPVEILIRSKAEMSGVEDAIKGLERLIGQAKALGQEYGHLESAANSARKAVSQFKSDQSAQAEASKTPSPATKAWSRSDSTMAQGMIPGLDAEIQKLKILGDDSSAAEAKLARLRAVASANGVQGDGWLGQLRQSLNENIPGFYKLDNILAGIGGKTLGLVAAGAGAVALAFKGAAASVREFAAAETEITRLDAALAQRGQLTEAYRQQLHDLADEMEQLTGVDDSQWITSITKLTQFGDNENSIHKQIEAVKNLAGLLGGDLNQAATLVAKAMQGSYEAFARYGIRVDEAGTQTEKFDKLCQTLALRGGGQLEALNKTLIGQWGQVKNALGDVTKAMGTKIASTGILQKALEMTGNAFEWYADKMKSVIPAVAGLTNATETTVQSLNDGADSAKRYAEAAEKIKKEAGLAADALAKMNAEVDKQRSREDRMDDLLKERDLKQWELVKEQRRRRGAPVSDIEDLGVKAGIEAKYAERKTGREISTEDKKLQNVQNTMAEDQRRMDQAAAELETARQRMAAAKRVDKFEGDIRALDKNDSSDRAKIEQLKSEEAAAKLEEAAYGRKQPSYELGVPRKTLDHSEEIAKLEQQIAERAKQRDVFQRRAEAEKAQAPANLKPLAKEQEYLGTVEKKYEAETSDDRQKKRDELARQADDLQKQIDSLNKELKVQRQARAYSTAAGVEKATADRFKAIDQSIGSGKVPELPQVPSAEQVARSAESVSPGAGREVRDLDREAGRVRRATELGADPYRREQFELRPPEEPKYQFPKQLPRLIQPQQAADTPRLDLPSPNEPKYQAQKQPAPSTQPPREIQPQVDPTPVTRVTNQVGRNLDRYNEQLMASMEVVLAIVQGNFTRMQQMQARIGSLEQQVKGSR